MGFSVQEVVNLANIDNLGSDISEPNNLCVYLHRRKDTGEIFYVGLGKPTRPFALSGRNLAWKKVVESYGYTIEIVAEGLTKAGAISKEIELIAKYRKVENNILTNITAGGQGHYGYKASEETKKKLRESHLGKKLPPEQVAKIRAKTTGQKRTPETLKRMSEARKGEKRTLEQIQKMSDAKKGKTISEKHKQNISNARKGWVFSEETRNKIGNAHRGKKSSAETCAKISLAKKGNTNRLGMTRTPEEKAKLSAALKGKPWSEARRAAYTLLGR
jgi:hypothetical protein